jgi:hypothetical protein
MNRLQGNSLFFRPSFLSGAARVLDLFGVFDSYDLSDSPEEADAPALCSDWRIVGQDVMNAVEMFDRGKEGTVRPKRRQQNMKRSVWT